MLITTVLLAVGVVAVFAGIRSLAIADSKARTADRLQRFAMQKINEIGTVIDPSTADMNGNFSDQGYPDTNWTADVATTNTTNIDKVTVTVTEGPEQQALSTMLYTAPAAGTTAGTGGTP
jgi:hypothetical protein